MVVPTGSPQANIAHICEPRSDPVPAGPVRGTSALGRSVCARCGCCSSTQRAAICCVSSVAVAAGIFFATLWVGAEVEDAKVSRARNTSWLYASRDVCAAVTGRAGERNVSTLKNVSSAQTIGARIMHCGACGGCSTREDIALYNATKLTLTKSATRCATKFFLGGRGSVDACFRDLGFSEPCRKCWVDNVVCDTKQCLFTCLRHIVQGSGNNDATGRLNPCLECDERM